MLCIAAQQFNAASETFIRSHVRTLAPGETVLLCRDGAGADALGCPMLGDIDPWVPPHTLGERVVNAVRHRWRVYIEPAIQGESRKRIVAFLDAHRVTALLAEYGPMGCLLVGACRDAAIPLYVHFHGYDASSLLRAPHQLRHYHALFRAAAGVVAPSRFLAAKLAAIGCPEEKLHIGPYGVDTLRFRPGTRMPGRIVAVGRLVEKKAPGATITAFARIAKRFPNARLDIVGDGPLRDRCIALINTLGLDGRISLHGAQANERVAELMQSASLFVQHSVTAEDGDTEGSGIPEIVRHGTTGLLVAEHDVTGMADAMAELIGNPARAAAMGVSGRSRVLARFTTEHARDRLRAILRLRGESPAGERAA
jgi:glycosyltransferase involved in cell wall biosynthesis